MDSIRPPARFRLALQITCRHLQIGSRIDFLVGTPISNLASNTRWRAGGPADRSSAFGLWSTFGATAGKPNGFIPDPGLVHFVESGHRLAPWKNHRAFLKEEPTRDGFVNTTVAATNEILPSTTRCTRCSRASVTKTSATGVAFSLGPVERIYLLRARAGDGSWKALTIRLYQPPWGSCALPFDEGV